MKYIFTYFWLFLAFCLLAFAGLFLFSSAEQQKVYFKGGAFRQITEALGNWNNGEKARISVPKPRKTPEISELSFFEKGQEKPAEKAPHLSKIKPKAKTKSILQKPVETARWYKVFWAGLHVADLFAEIREVEHDQYSISAAIKSYGLARVISKYKSDSSAMASLGADGEFTPVSFRTRFTMRNRTRDIYLRYSAGGEVIYETNFPPENRHKRKEVPDDMKRNAYDPLTIVLVARKKIMEAMMNGGKKNFSIALYDGRRRSEFAFKVFGKNKDGLIHISIREQAVSGYTDNEIKAMQERSPIMNVFLDEKDYLPVKATGESQLGDAYIALKKHCKTIIECIKSAKSSPFSL